MRPETLLDFMGVAEHLKCNMRHSRMTDHRRESVAEHTYRLCVFAWLIKEEFPNISLGTVYRNLNLLADIGEALRIPTPAGGDRFDGRCEPHYHVVCTNCGKVFDLEMDDSYIQKINEDANACFDGIIESHNTLFHGLCPDCIKKKNENK